MADDDSRSSFAGIAFVALTILGVVALGVLVIVAIPVVFVFNWLTILLATAFVSGAYVLHRWRRRKPGPRKP